MAYKTVFYALGTENTITVEDDYCANVLADIIERVFEIEAKMSSFKAESEISLISQSAGVSPIKVSGDVYNVLEKALEMGDASGGAFDITVKPLTALWNFGRGTDIIPDKSQLDAAKAVVGYINLKLDPEEHTAFLLKNGSSIDLGGIAKGYAADEAKRILLKNGIENALINFGGNVYAVGNDFDKTPWQIGIQNPLSTRGESVLTLDVTNKSVVTSAVNERFFIKDGIRYHHIISPLTGSPAQNGLLSVTIISQSSIIADALSTAIFVLGIDKGMELIRKYKSNAVLITEKGDILTTLKLSPIIKRAEQKPET